MLPESPSEIECQGFKSPSVRRNLALAVGLVTLAFVGLQYGTHTWLSKRVMRNASWRWGPRLETVHSSTVVRWNGDLWYIAAPMQGTEEQAEAKGRNILVHLGPDGPKTVCSLPAGWAWLATNDGQLLILSSDGLSSYDGKEFRQVPAKALQGPISQPFKIGGELATIGRLDAKYVVWALHNSEWREKTALSFGGELPEKLLPDRIKAVVVADTAYLFVQKDDAIFCRNGFEDKSGPFPEGWAKVASAAQAWAAGVEDRKPVLFVVALDGPFSRRIVAYRQEGETWKESFSRRVGYPPHSIGLAGDDTGMALLWQAVPWSVNVLEFSAEKDAQVRRFGELPSLGSPQTLLALLPLLVSGGISLLMMLALFGLMKAWRTDLCMVAGVPVRLASLPRRGLALWVDGLILGLPLLGAFVITFRALARVEDRPNEAAMFLTTLCVLGAITWSLVGTLLFCYAQGRWGRTPGKWLAGIRVIGSDLRPCGFWRALLRTVLLVVDGFVSFALGMVLIALGSECQRAGDFIARTIVIRDEPLPVDLDYMRRLAGAGEKIE